MPFSSTDEVKRKVDGTDDMSERQLTVYMDTFNGCVDAHDGQEQGEDFDCFAIAMDNAQSAGGGES